MHGNVKPGFDISSLATQACVGRRCPVTNAPKFTLAELLPLEHLCYIRYHNIIGGLGYLRTSFDRSYFLLKCYIERTPMTRVTPASIRYQNDCSFSVTVT